MGVLSISCMSWFALTISCAVLEEQLKSEIPRQMSAQNLFDHKASSSCPKLLGVESFLIQWCLTPACARDRVKDT